MKVLFVNEMINDHKLDVLCLTETWLKLDEYIILNESAHPRLLLQKKPRPKGKGGGGGGLLQVIPKLSVFLRRQTLNITPLKKWCFK